MFVKEGRLYVFKKALTDLTSGLFVGLLKVDETAPDDNVAAANYLADQCDFAGYTAAPVAFTGPAIIDGSGNAYLETSPFSFTAGAIMGPQTIFSLALLYNDGSAIHMLDFTRMSPPVTFTAPGHSITRTYKIYLRDYTP